MWGALIGAGVGLLGSLFGADAEKDAASTAAQATREAAQQNTALAREQRAKNETLFSPYLEDEGRANAYSDALTFGQGSYGGMPAYSGPQVGGSDWNAYLAAHPGIMEEYNAGQTPWAKRARDAGATTPEQIASHYQQTWGGQQGFSVPTVTAEQAAAAAPPQQTITRDDVMRQIEASPLYQSGESEYADAEALNTQERDALYGLAGDERGQAEGEASRRRGDVERTAGTDYDRTLSYLDADHRTRTGYLTQADAARQRLLDTDKERADAYANATLAGTGLTGAASRQRTEDQNNLNDQYAQWRYGEQQAIYDPYATGRIGASNLYGSRLMDSAGQYGDDQNAARGIYYDRMNPATQNYYTRRQSNTANRYGARNTAYGDFQDQLATRQNQGFNARSQIASGGQSYVNTVTNQNTNAARASADAAYRRGEATAGAYGAIGEAAGALGGAYDEYVRNRKPRREAYAYS